MKTFLIKYTVAILSCGLLLSITGLTSHASLIEQKSIDIVFTGDTSFGENYLERVDQKGRENILKTRGYQYSIENFSDFLQQADLVIANLETPLTDLPESPFANNKSYLHWGDPVKVPKALKRNNIHVVSLANNHSLDYGIQGLQQSIDALNEHNIRWFGAGMNEASSNRPLQFDYLISEKNTKIIVAAGFEYRKHYDEKYAFYSRNEQGGTNAWTLERASAQIKELRRENHRAFIIAYPHFGPNYTWKTQSQAKLARTLIDAGADLVLGHGSHMVQEIERYKGRWIIYSLGNFVFNSPGRYKKEKADPFSLLAQLNISHINNEMKFILNLYPIFSNNRISHYQPYFVTQDQFNRVHEILLLQSTDDRLQSWMTPKHNHYGHHLSLDVTPIKQ